MNKYIHTLFPTCVMQSDIDRDFTDEELQFVTNQYHNVYDNYGNSTSVNTRILECAEMTNLKTLALEAVNGYVNSIFNPSTNLQFYITQSWLNYTEPNGYHHQHIHQNSILSGVIYINVDPATDSITFFSNNPSQFLIEPISYTGYNQGSFTLSVDVGDIIIFPSNLQHNVAKTQNDLTRISLAFNTFVRGELGCEKSLSALSL